MKSFNVMALDANFQIISLIRYTSIQWNRKWHEPGNFSVEIPLGQYDKNIKYIYTKDRPEMGKVTQINFINKSGYKSIHLSGYFLEAELNRMVVYPSSLNNISSAPLWDEKTGNAETVAHAFFDSFSSISFYARGISAAEWKSSLGIQKGQNKNRGKTADHTRNGEYLGDKLYFILKASGLSYRVSYEFENNVKRWNVVNGFDRTDTQSANNRVTFSTKYGNIKNPNVLIDSSKEKNCVISKGTFTVNVEEYVDPEHTKSISYQGITASAYANRQASSTVCYEDSFLYMESSADLQHDEVEDNFYEWMMEDAKNTLGEYVQTLNVEFDAMEGSYEYGVDFDIGDVVNIEIYEIGLSVTARLIGCNEVVKGGKWTLTLEFGTPLVKYK